MRTLLSAALLFSLFILVGCGGGTPDSEPVEGQDAAEEMTDEEEAAEMELENEGDDLDE